MRNKELKKQVKKVEKQRGRESGKSYGECESCGMHTTLVSVVGMCGPCTFGEADTINGNW